MRDESVTNCYSCQVVFSVLVRKHHCRVSGIRYKFELVLNSIAVVWTNLLPQMHRKQCAWGVIGLQQEFSTRMQFLLQHFAESKFA